jgi:MYXO-CTERM domain-containing protein
VAGQGGEGGMPIFNLGGDGGIVIPTGGFAGDLGFDAGGLLLPDGGLSPQAVDLAKGCACSVPGNDSNGSGGALVVLGLVGVLWQRRRRVA